MRGHESIINMRLCGKKPRIVFLNDYPCKTDWFEHGDHATVEISHTDRPEWLDLRFLIGLRVGVAGSDEKRLKQLFDACKKAGAESVAACVVHKSVDNFYKVPVYSAGWAEIWHREVT